MSHFFSRVQLLASPYQHDWLRDLERHGKAYRDHALIWRLFPGDGRERDFIFRRLEDERSFYVVSARRPQDETGLFQIHCKPYFPGLEEGTWLRFDLRANPTVTVRQTEGKSRRHDVLMHAKRQARAEQPEQSEQLAQALEAAGKRWLLGRAEQWGLRFLEESVLQHGYQQHRLKHKGRQIEYSSLDYQGMAQVGDPLRLRNVLLNGVGHGKGFGCGLLLVKRAD